MGTSIVGISGNFFFLFLLRFSSLNSDLYFFCVFAGGNTFSSAMSRQRSINHALASNEMLRLSGAPARGWYPRQRTLRPASTENIDHLSSTRVWDTPAGMSGTGQMRKPCTLPPNLTPSFLHKSPREALRRVTSLLITKKSKFALYFKLKPILC